MDVNEIALGENVEQKETILGPELGGGGTFAFKGQ